MSDFSLYSMKFHCVCARIGVGIFLCLLPEQQLISLNKINTVLYGTSIRVFLSLGRIWVQFCLWSIRFGYMGHFRWTYLKRDPPRCKYGFPSSSLFFAKHRRMKIMHIKLTIGITTFILFKNRSIKTFRITVGSRSIDLK